MAHINVTAAAALLKEAIKQARETFIEQTGVIPRINLVDTQEQTNCGTRGGFEVEVSIPLIDATPLNIVKE